MKILFKVIALIALTCTSSIQAGATTYTALYNGDNTIATSWVNGLNPSGAFHNDTMIIPAGITVYFSTPISFTDTGNVFIINGTLWYPGNLDLHNCKVYGQWGRITDVDSLTGISSLNHGFFGDVDADIVVGDTITTDVSVGVRSKLYLYECMDMFDGGIYFNNIDIYVGGSYGPTPKGASINIHSGASISSTTDYNLTYLYGNAIIGDEWRHTATITIKIEDTCELVMRKNLRNPFTSLIRLYSGSLNLNGYNLELDCPLILTDGKLKSKPSSNILTYACISPNVRFAPGSDTINSINFLGGCSKILLKSDLYIGGELNSPNTNIDIDSNNTLTLLRHARMNLNGRHVTTNYNAFLSASILPTTSFTFPLANYTHYMPCTIIAKNNSDYDEFKVNLYDGVSLDGSNERQPKTGSYVAATWTLEYTGSNIDYDMEVQWLAHGERNSFNRDACYISNYGNNGWDRHTPSKATTVTTDTYKQIRRHIKTTGKFSVFDTSTFVSVKNISGTDKIEIYPNPATDVVYVNIDLPVNAVIYNSYGQVVSKRIVSADNKAINIASLPQGIYYLHLKGEAINDIAKFIKQ